MIIPRSAGRFGADAVNDGRRAEHDQRVEQLAAGGDEAKHFGTALRTGEKAFEKVGELLVKHVVDATPTT